MLTTFKNLDTINDEKNATIELMIPPYYKEYYFKKYNRRFNSIYYNSFNEKSNPKGFRGFVQHLQTNYFIAGNLPLEYLEIIKEKYPFLISKEEGFTYSVSCFSKEKVQSSREPQPLFSKKLDVSNANNKLDTAIEYSQAFTFQLNDIVYSRHSIINLSARLFVPDSSSNPILVMEILENGKSLKWNGSEYFSYNNQPKTANTIFLSTSLTAFNLKEHPNAEVKIYIWNRDKKEAMIQDMNMEVVKANPFIYALYEPID